MSTFNSLSYTKQLINAGVPREQAEAHAQGIQGVFDEEHKYYASKADFLEFGHQIKQQISHLEQKTDQLEIKTDRLEDKTDRLQVKMTEIEEHIIQLKVEVSTEICGLNNKISECKAEFSYCRADIAALKISHKYLLWIGGGMLTMCFSVFALSIPMLLHTLK